MLLPPAQPPACTAVRPHELGHVAPPPSVWYGLGWYLQPPNPYHKGPRRMVPSFPMPHYATRTRQPRTRQPAVPAYHSPEQVPLLSSPFPAVTPEPTPKPLPQFFN